MTGAPLLVCYVPGLDARRIDGRRTPYLHELRQQFPVTGLRTLPCTELVPTLISGTLPHQHRVWQVCLRHEFRDGAATGLLGQFSDGVVSTVQLVRTSSTVPMTSRSFPGDVGVVSSCTASNTRAAVPRLTTCRNLPAS